MSVPQSTQLSAPIGLVFEPIDMSRVDDLVLAVLCGAETASQDDAIQSFCIAELTDGRLTGVTVNGEWALSIDEFPADGPSRLRADKADWWRLRSLRIFSETEELRITGDDGELTGIWLSDEELPDVQAPDGPSDPSRPRDRKLVVDAGSSPSRSFDQRRDGSPGARKPESVRNQYFVRVTTPAYRTHVVPAPGNTAESLRGARTMLAVREYFAEVSDTGAVGVQEQRLLSFESSQRSSK